MPLISFKNIEITGIAVCVPKETLINKESGKDLFDETSLSKAIQTTGIEERRISNSESCASDLCFYAAEKLLSTGIINRNEIDILLFVSQTPDYRLPATACILQHRLGLSKKTGAYDINLGCSGYVYGLSAAFSYANLPEIRNVLLLVGDTVTKFVSPRDKASSLLFGDAGSATLISKSSLNQPSYFSLYTDGEGYKSLIIPYGGYRNPGSPKSYDNINFLDGSIRNSEQLIMDGGEIFNFTIREIPKNIHELISYAGLSLEDIDYMVFHQANRFMLDFITKKLKYPKDKVPLSLSSFGNTSSASIPLTIISQLKNHLPMDSTILMSGFGVGLSWASAIINLNNCLLINLIEYK